jgi:hypothetical protein
MARASRGTLAAIHRRMQTLSREQLDTVNGGAALPGGPQIPTRPNWGNGAREGVRGYSEARQQGHGQARSAWEGVRSGVRGLFR